MKVVYTPKIAGALDRKLAHLTGDGSRRAAERIAKVVAEGNRRDRLAGIDEDGVAVAPLKHPRTGPYKDKAGPPLAPDGARSRVVASFLAVVRRVGRGWEIVCGWPGADFLAYHDKGAGKLPRRGISGMSPRTRAEVAAEVERLKREVKAIR